MVSDWLFRTITWPLQKLCDFLNWWATPDQVTPVPCPYCKSTNRLDVHNCQYSYEHPEYGVSGADPPCLCDNFACRHQRELGIRC